jgi:hypothetical protein
MITEDDVLLLVDRRDDPDGHRLLADAGVRRAGQLAAGEFIEQHLLKSANPRQQRVLLGRRRSPVADRNAQRIG